MDPARRQLNLHMQFGKRGLGLSVERGTTTMRERGLFWEYGTVRVQDAQPQDAGQSALRGCTEEGFCTHISPTASLILALPGPWGGSKAWWRQHWRSSLGEFQACRCGHQT